MEKELGDKFSADELFSSLRLKKGKDGITISVAGAR
jgi:hypothetical protein